MDEEPISPDEYVLRKFHRTHYRSPPPPINRSGFEPRSDEEDGLSFYRERYTSIETLAQSGRSPGQSYICRFRVADLLALGVQLTSTPGDLPGHVVLPELSYPALRGDRDRGRILQAELADLAGLAIVFRPDPKPDAT